MSFTTSVNRFQSQLYNYCDWIPKNTLKEAISGATVAFVLGTLFSGDPAVGAIGGGLSFVATLIHGIVSPLFQNFRGDNRELSLLEETLRTSIALLGTSLAAASIGYKNPLMLFSSGLTTHLLGIAFFSSWRQANRAHFIFP